MPIRKAKQLWRRVKRTPGYRKRKHIAKKLKKVRRRYYREVARKRRRTISRVRRRVYRRR